MVIHGSACQSSLDSIYTVTYNIKWVKTSWTRSNLPTWLESFLEDGNNLWEDALPELADQVAQGPRRNLPLVVAGAGQAGQQQVEQRRQDLPQGPGEMIQ